MSNYALITAAKNEENYIGYTLEAVVNQTILPDLWVIVDDGSSDTTHSIVKKYQKKHPFIKVLRRDQSEKRDFSSKVYALKHAYAHIAPNRYDYIGNIDADVSFSPSYYADLIRHFEEDEKLGIGGGVIWEKKKGKWVYVHGNPDWCVGGATQMFRQQCLADTGFYPLLPHGGEDTVLEYLARHHGWKVKAFSDCTIHHHKPLSSANKSIFQICYHSGKQEYHWGSSLLFQFSKCASRLFKHPFLLGGLLQFAGFFIEVVKAEKKVISTDIEKIIKSQQLKRLGLPVRSQD